MRADDILAEIEALSVILRRGALDEIPVAASRVEAALAAAGALPPAARDRLRDRAGLLRRQLEGTARGIRSAQARLTELRAALAGPSTYDEAGRRSDMATTTSLARRF